MSILKKNTRPKKHLFKNNKIKTNDSSTEIERITNQLITETIGSDGLIEKFYNKFAKDYNATNKPVGLQDVEYIISALLKLAAAQRAVLAGRIQESVEDGALFEQYYGRMEIINELTVEAAKRKKEMVEAREQYEYQNSIHKKMLARMYVRKFSPDEDDIKETNEEDEMINIELEDPEIENEGEIDVE